MKNQITEDKNTNALHPENNAAITEAIMDAVKSIILDKGVRGLHELTIDRLEEVSGQSKNVLYAHFGTLEGVIRSFVKLNVPFLGYGTALVNRETVSEDRTGKAQRDIGLFQTYLNNCIDNPLLQQINLIELNKFTESNISSEIAYAREQLMQEVFDKSASSFSDGDMDIQVIYALLLGGISYLGLRQTNLDEATSTVNRQSIHNTIETIVNRIYKGSQPDE